MEGDSMSDKKFPEDINPERREFIEKVTKGAFIIPTVISVMMLNQKLNLTTANAQSNMAGVCLSSVTFISTPGGDVPVTELKPGMPVYTLDPGGSRIVEPLELVSKASVPETHMVCRVNLSDGRELFVSGGHPTSDGIDVERLSDGQTLDGGIIESIEKVPYKAGFTYDLLPAGETGCYWANGILLGSTLSPNSNGKIRKAA
jgi:hypothetical protein